MKRALVVLAAALACAAAALADPGHEPYLVGSVLNRIPGQNAAHVGLRWNFYCLNGQYGDGTYTYRIVLHRLQPKPETATPLVHDTARAGTYDVNLRPGLYRADADPFHCEAGIGLSSSVAEKGLTFVVPDYCTFVADHLNGRVTAAGRPLRADARVRPGNVVVVPKRGTLVLFDEGDTQLEFIGPTRATLERGACATTPGWRWTLQAGTLIASSPGAAARYEIAAGAVVVSGRAASWATARDGGKVTVSVQRGRVTVRVRGKTTTVGRGRSYTFS